MINMPILCQYGVFIVSGNKSGTLVYLLHVIYFFIYVFWESSSSASASSLAPIRRKEGGPRKMRWQGVATPGPTHRVSVGVAHSLRLPLQSHTDPLRRLPPAPLPRALLRGRQMMMMVQTLQKMGVVDV